MNAHRIVRAAACLAALAVAPASARADAHASPGSPEGFAALALAHCIGADPAAAPDFAAMEAAGLTLDTEDGAAAVLYSEVATLDMAYGEGTLACEMRLPADGEAVFEARAETLSVAIGETFDVADLETVEDGIIWRLVPAEGMTATAEWRDDGISHLFTSIVEPGERMEGSE